MATQLLISSITRGCFERVSHRRWPVHLIITSFNLPKWVHQPVKEKDKCDSIPHMPIKTSPVILGNIGNVIKSAVWGDANQPCTTLWGQFLGHTCAYSSISPFTDDWGATIVSADGHPCWLRPTQWCRCWSCPHIHESEPRTKMNSGTSNSSLETYLQSLSKFLPTATMGNLEMWILPFFTGRNTDPVDPMPRGPGIVAQLCVTLPQRIHNFTFTVSVGVPPGKKDN